MSVFLDSNSQETTNGSINEVNDEKRKEVLAEIASLQQELLALQEEIDRELAYKTLPPTPLGSHRVSMVEIKQELDKMTEINTTTDFPERSSSLSPEETTAELLLNMAIDKNAMTGTQRSSQPDQPPPITSPTTGSFRSRKISTMTKSEQQRLEMITTAKKKFNMSPKIGIQYLIENKYFPSSDPSPQEIAAFLFTENDMLSRSVLGEYLGDHSPINVEIFNFFVNSHSFHNMPFDQALRAFLKSFRLPGEAQKIDRMMEKFAERYIKCNPSDLVIKHVDTAYILAFSVIMLNTDLHNPAVKNKIRKSLFVRNNLDVVAMNAAGEGEDKENDVEKPNDELFEDFLAKLYDVIKEAPLEIVNPDEDDLLNNNPLYFTFFNPEREGWLVKQGGRIKTWKKRYCILTGSCLYYFKNETTRDFQESGSEKKQQPCGIIPLENLQVEALDIVDGGSGVTKKKYFFRLHLSEDIEIPSSPDSPVDPSQSLSSSNQSSQKLFKKLRNTIKAAKTLSDGKIVEGRHSDYLFMCETDEERNDWMQSIRGQMAKPPMYSLYEKRKNRFNKI